MFHVKHSPEDAEQYDRAAQRDPVVYLIWPPDETDLTLEQLRLLWKRGTPVELEPPHG